MKKNQVGEIQPDQSFHKNLVGLRSSSCSTLKTELTFKKKILPNQKIKKLRVTIKVFSSLLLFTNDNMESCSFRG